MYLLKISTCQKSEPKQTVQPWLLASYEVSMHAASEMSAELSIANRSYKELIWFSKSLSRQCTILGMVSNPTSVKLSDGVAGCWKKVGKLISWFKWKDDGIWSMKQGFIVSVTIFSNMRYWGFLCSACISATILADVIASKVTIFHDICRADPWMGMKGCFNALT